KLDIIVSDNTLQERSKRPQRRRASRRPCGQAQDQETRLVLAFAIEHIELVIPCTSDAGRATTHRSRKGHMRLLCGACREWNLDTRLCLATQLLWKVIVEQGAIPCEPLRGEHLECLRAHAIIGAAPA